MRQSDQPALRARGGLTLRRWFPYDAGELVNAFSDPAIQHWHMRRVLSLEEARDLISEWNQCWRAETDGHWAIVRDDMREVAGRVSLRKIDLKIGCAECSYWILPAVRGRGIATGALLALTCWALDDLGLHRLELAHSVNNLLSCRVANKAGFRLEATKRSALLHEDGWHDMHLHARIQGDTL